MVRFGIFGSEYDEFVDVLFRIGFEGEFDFDFFGSVYRVIYFNGDVFNNVVLQNYVEVQKIYILLGMKFMEFLLIFGVLVEILEVVIEIKVV